VSCGRWVAADRSRVYRVLVRTGGFEHVVSEALVEWIAMDKGEPQVVASRLAPTGTWRLDHPRILGAGTEWRVELEALETHSVPVTRVQWVARLGIPGQLSASHALRSCGLSPGSRANCPRQAVLPAQRAAGIIRCTGQQACRGWLLRSNVRPQIQ
jgi:hypothetical protein